MPLLPMVHLCSLFEENALFLPQAAIPTVRHLGFAATAAAEYNRHALSSVDAGDTGGANYASRRAVELAGPAASEAARVACLVFDEVPVLPLGWLRAAAAYLHLAATTLDAAADATAAVRMTNGDDAPRRRRALEACVAMAQRRAGDAQAAHEAARNGMEAHLSYAVVSHQAARAMVHARGGAGAARSMTEAIFPTATVHAAVVTAAELRALGRSFRFFAEAANSATLAQAVLVQVARGDMASGDRGLEAADMADVNSDSTEPWDLED